MSLKKNIIANYIGQGYITLIGIFMPPFYLEYLGAEAYGLVGFFSLIGTLLAVLSMGLSPTLARQIALERGRDEHDFFRLRQLLRSIELIFLILTLSVGLGIGLGSFWIADHWLSVEQLPQSDVAYCISLMGIIIGSNWFGLLYRGGIQGTEKMVWLSVAGIIMASLRYLLAYAMLRWLTNEPRHFFEFQLAISLIELVLFGIKFYSLLPRTHETHYGFSWSALKAVLPFTSGIAYTSSLWILLTQSDKLILSHLLPLREYGYFALVGVVANGLLTLVYPVSQALLPRLTLLLSQGNEHEMPQLYRKATQLVATIIFPIAGTIALFSKQVLYAWTGDSAAALWASPILTWFILGNCILTMTVFPNYLQYAHGKLRLQVINSSINAVVQLPILLYAANYYGVLGVAYSWFGIRLLAFFIFPAIVHCSLVQGLHSRWLFVDILPRLLVTLICLTLSSIVMSIFAFQSREALVLFIGCVVSIAIAFNAGLYFLMQYCLQFKWFHRL